MCVCVCVCVAVCVCMCVELTATPASAQDGEELDALEARARRRAALWWARYALYGAAAGTTGLCLFGVLADTCGWVPDAPPTKQWWEVWK